MASARAAPELALRSQPRQSFLAQALDALLRHGFHHVAEGLQRPRAREQQVAAHQVREAERLAGAGDEAFCSGGDQRVRGDDGYFRMRGNATAEVDPKVKVHGGALEGSNVNVVEAMVSMISISRQFDMQMKILQNADGNDRQAAQLLSMR